MREEQPEYKILCTYHLDTLAIREFPEAKMIAIIFSLTAVNQFLFQG